MWAWFLSSRRHAVGREGKPGVNATPSISPALPRAPFLKNGIVSRRLDASAIVMQQRWTGRAANPGPAAASCVIPAEWRASPAKAPREPHA